MMDYDALRSSHHSAHCSLAPNKAVEDTDTLVNAPECNHEWYEMVDEDGQPVEPPYDICIHCGEGRH